MPDINENNEKAMYPFMPGNAEKMPPADKKALTGAVLEMVKMVADGEIVTDKDLEKFVRAKNKETHDCIRIVAKRRLMPEYLRLKKDERMLLMMSGMNENVDKKVTALLQAKPRRTASGVATITVLTKPWPCSGNCIFCPNDIRMPKSYMHNEPACQRAERWNFDPYMQVTSRLHVLYDMGHNIDKIELIILGGTFTDYPREYQNWFVMECFRACNDFPERTFLLTGPYVVSPDDGALHRLPNDRTPSNLDELAYIQKCIDAGELTYNEAWKIAYGDARCSSEYATLDEVKEQHRINESAGSRIVGLVAETRPDRASFEDLVHLRELGCTKVQIGIQTIDQRILDLNKRNTTVEAIIETLKNMRTLGFKSHVHIMANLLGSMPGIDKKVYKQLVSDADFMPDEVKIYPCCLVESAALKREYEAGNWKPYSEEELLDVVVTNICDTPPQTRISRMIRDISTQDIIAGNKKPNLRQLVEEKLRADGKTEGIQEMRFREIANDEVVADELELQDVTYKTNSSEEHFLQYVTKENRLVAFLRLSLPKAEALCPLPSSKPQGADCEETVTGLLPDCEETVTEPVEGPSAQNPSGTVFEILKDSAMIREVHVYGKVQKIHSHVDSAQHLGLGTKLINRAFEISHNAGYARVNVISAVGTREYYRSLGFVDNNLYQTKYL